MKNLFYSILSVLILVSCNTATDKIELPSIISNGMVLQQNATVKLWGWSNPSAIVTFEPSWGQKSKVSANDSGYWETTIKTLSAGGPYEIIIVNGDTAIHLTDILFGEVWLCSGQSNMEMPLAGFLPNDTIMNSATEIASANYSDIRMFTVEKQISIQPLEKCQGKWLTANSKNVPIFSATGYFFGKKLHQQLGVPIGLIHSSWGGTPAESWTKAEYLKGVKGYENIDQQLLNIQNQDKVLRNWMSTLNKIPATTDPEFYANLELNDSVLSEFDFNDSSLAEMEVPSYWETNVLPGFDGVVWLRKSFDLPEVFANKSLVLHLGKIDDMDVTYFNGEKIGEIQQKGFYNKDRNYTIPANIVKAGKNTVAVRVTDNTGGGGIYSKSGIFISAGESDKSIVDLSGKWKYQPVAEILNNVVYVYGSFEKAASRPKTELALNPGSPASLYNGMISPIQSFTLKGVIWYQGEANVGRGYQYQTLFPALIQSWRSVMKQDSLPFYYVQIAPYNYGDNQTSITAELREAQLMTLQLQNTGMVVTTDIGNPKNIHPANKTDIGYRLANIALAKTYGFDTLVYSGPIYKSFEIEENQIRINFDHANGGLVIKGKVLTHFEIAGEDQVFYPAQAQIDGKTILVSSVKVKKPLAVRFGWDQIAEPNLFNGSGLPASPFRTDNWKRISQ